MKAIYWNEEDLGETYDIRDIPAELQGLAEEKREFMIESAAEANEELMEKYLEEGTLTEDEIIEGIRLRTIANEIIPMFCGSAFKKQRCSSNIRCNDNVYAIAARCGPYLWYFR